ncbi:MAG: hypothetical protein KJP25_10975 [Gammaproteobacteria bacterium]|nr:hypothetical protein [Gammaproteobacteria bacterium]MBT8151354.1 hypothetical protein [Gammaproteobacteria bacterium]NND39040.1 hypothetical protein [Pseudomonadales bacterium]NNM12017.1 hypothetical protein [Pseudomonadales bacterium]RZV49760.1 MAG: hypothetical protein EX270_12205 [Pseudomonadales bacterium]
MPAKPRRRRAWRTLLLGLLALLAICYALVAYLDRTVYEVLLLLGAGAVAVLVLALLGALCGYLMYRLRNRRRP